jgi:hypothetical protein
MLHVGFAGTALGMLMLLSLRGWAFVAVPLVPSVPSVPLALVTLKALVFYERPSDPIWRCTQCTIVHWRKNTLKRHCHNTSIPFQAQLLGPERASGAPK